MASQKKKTKEAGSKKKQPVVTTAFHAESEDGAEHLVSIGNLRVALFNDDGSWFAQGLEIDYFAQGASMEDVQRRFQEGLKETIDFHLKMYGNIGGVLRVAPAEVWAEFYSDQPGLRKRFSQVSVHVVDQRLASVLPFEAIDFYGVEQVAA